MENARFKCSFIGDFSTGKTSIIHALLDSPKLDPTSTLGIDFFTKTISYAGKLIHLSIWDTAGSERFHSLMHSYLRDSSLIVIVYDTTKATSNIIRWMRIAEQHSPQVVGIVGNKTDLTLENNENFDELLFPWSRQDIHIVRSTCSARDSASVKDFMKRCLKELMVEKFNRSIQEPIQFHVKSPEPHTCCT